MALQPRFRPGLALRPVAVPPPPGPAVPGDGAWKGRRGEGAFRGAGWARKLRIGKLTFQGARRREAPLFRRALCRRSGPWVPERFCSARVRCLRGWGQAPAGEIGATQCSDSRELDGCSDEARKKDTASRACPAGKRGVLLGGFWLNTDSFSLFLQPLRPQLWVRGPRRLVFGEKPHWLSSGATGGQTGETREKAMPGLMNFNEQRPCSYPSR